MPPTALSKGGLRHAVPLPGANNLHGAGRRGLHGCGQLVDARTGDSTLCLDGEAVQAVPLSRETLLSMMIIMDEPRIS
jgi:hypothetical protein